MLKLSIKKKKGTYCDVGVCVFYFLFFINNLIDIMEAEFKL